MVQTLIDKGFAYVEDGDVYFSVAKFPSYGKLSRQRPEDLMEGESAGEGKRHPADFALWKAAKPGGAFLGQPVGSGTPRLAHRVLGHVLAVPGNSFDFHGGGVDLIFPPS